MGRAATLPKLSKFALDALAAMGFKPISGRPYDFIGSVKQQHEEYPMAALLTVMPLQLQQGTYVISLEMNGEQMVKARMATLEEVANIVGYAGVVKEILTIVGRKENEDDHETDGTE